VGKKKRDKHEFELAQSFIEVQDAYEMLTHSLQCTALVSGFKKKNILNFRLTLFHLKT
jgi:hydrogenase maturation factor